MLLKKEFFFSLVEPFVSYSWHFETIFLGVFIGTRLKYMRLPLFIYSVHFLLSAVQALPNDIINVCECLHVSICCEVRTECKREKSVEKMCTYYILDCDVWHNRRVLFFHSVTLSLSLFLFPFPISLPKFVICKSILFLCKKHSR